MGVIYQFARPLADLNFSPWSRQPSGGSLASAIDEAGSPDAERIVCNSSPLSGDPDFTYKCSLTTVADPGTSSARQLAFTAGHTGGGGRFFGWEVRQGAAQIASGTVVITSTPQEFVVAVPGAITDYSQLQLWFTLLGDTTQYTAFVEVAELRVPLTFRHAVEAGAGLVEAAAGSGEYLEDAGAGLRRVAGVEGTTSLVLSGPGLRRRAS